ncbi:Predicted arabinose efflux permease, MFS family [Pseudonocardia thermophila]|uniref:Predicted arabinose efflux permease, MFS family n=1 Tax=Pseudonocardia thermophila TaxID=1848 RepID=A0A1M6Q402_PSETH|nr:MFS transporter [Pseudonocardia thermophila]SHK14900.1 Predicted arabinose efflux permease, MFS family [Pseudonocardia thermophila]
MTTSASTVPDEAVGGSRSHDRGFWIVAFTFAVTMAFSAVPAPLYVLYQAEQGFGPFTTTIIFAVYAVGVLASLFLAGHVSDWVGRRRILVPAVLVNILAGLIFLEWTSVPALLVARFVSGVSVGMLTATATAHLAELHMAARPGSGRTRVDVVATAANLGGIGVGALVAGVLAQYVTAPLHVPYLVFQVLLVIAALGLTLVPETVEPWRMEYRPQKVTVPREGRGRYFAASAAVLVYFAVFGLFTSLSPAFLAGVLHQDSHALAGGATFVVFAGAALAQILLSRSPARHQASFGLTALVLGLVLVTVAVQLPDLPLFLIGGVIAGSGAGAGFKTAMGIVLSVSRPQARGEALAGLFLAAYVGLSVPVLGLGLAVQLVPVQAALIGFTAVLLVILAVIGRRLVTAAR